MTQIELKKLRNNKAYTQEYVANTVRISKGGYANIEPGKRTPSVTIAKRLGKLLNFDWTLFYEEKV